MKKINGLIIKDTESFTHNETGYVHIRYQIIDETGYLGPVLVGQVTAAELAELLNPVRAEGGGE